MRVMLTVPHTHGGTLYPEGASLDICHADAQWLIERGLATEAPKATKQQPHQAANPTRKEI